MLESRNDLEFLSGIAAQFAQTKSIQEDFNLAVKLCSLVVGTNATSIFLYNENSRIFIRRSFLSDSSFTDESFPHYLKLAESFIKKNTDLYFINNNYSYTVFENEFVLEGHTLFIPINSESQTRAFVLCANMEPISISEEQNYYIKYLQATLHSILQKNSLQELVNELQYDLDSKTGAQTQKLQVINERLKKSNAELKQFAYMASHDLQEPLRMISNYIDLFLKKYASTIEEDGLEYLAFAKDGAVRMHALVKDLLTYARLDYSAEQKTFFNGERALNEALHNLQVAVKENDALIFYADMPELYGNENELIRLFQNLVDNGIKYKSESAPIIFIDNHEEQTSWNFSVKDNGIGIEKNFHEKIFEFFSRLHSKGDYTGTGLGLSICKKIVEKHFGKISVNSIPGQGTNFEFSLAKH